MDWTTLLPQIPPGTPAWLYLLCVGGAVMVIGISKAGFGGGVGIVAVPLMAIALPADQTIGVMLPVLIVADFISIYHHRGTDSRPHLRWMTAGALIGIVVGTLILWQLQQEDALEQALNLIIGGLCLFFVALQVYRIFGGYVPHLPRTAGTGRSAGFLAGVVSTLMHGAGPVMSIYLLEQRLAKRELVGTAVVFIFAVNVLKLPTYFGLSLINPPTLVQSLWCLPLVPLGTLIGIWMHRRINEKAFSFVMYAGAAAAAVHMLYEAFA
jgi:uncharacterized membrane protein YfcA